MAQQINESQVKNLVTDLAAKAPLASPAFTGTPTAPTASAGTTGTQLATLDFVATAIANQAKKTIIGSVQSMI